MQIDRQVQRVLFILLRDFFNSAIKEYIDWLMVELKCIILPLLETKNFLLQISQIESMHK